MKERVHACNDYAPFLGQLCQKTLKNSFLGTLTGRSGRQTSAEVVNTDTVHFQREAENDQAGRSSAALGSVEISEHVTSYLQLQ
jgi:hypothetical protein